MILNTNLSIIFIINFQNLFCLGTDGNFLLSLKVPVILHIKNIAYRLFFLLIPAAYRLKIYLNVLEIY